jgi:hypothetical protein
MVPRQSVVRRSEEAGFVAHIIQMIAAAEVGHGRISSMIKENLPNVATPDFEEASAWIPHCVCRISGPASSGSAAKARPWCS